jgi:hypothetical protein
MAHLVMDTIIGHELDVIIRQSEIERRGEEWHKLVVGTLSRSDYIKGLLAFGGLELIEYHTAVVEQTIPAIAVRVRSKAWALRQ